MLCHALIDCALFHEHFGQYLGIRLGENGLTNGRKNWVHSTRMLRIIVDSSAHVAPTHQELGGLHKMKIEKKKKILLEKDALLNGVYSAAAIILQ